MAESLLMATLVTPAEKTEKLEKRTQSPMPEDKTERKPRPRVDEKFKIFSGTANETLADEVCAFLGMNRGQAEVKRFADGECYVQLQENVRGCDVFVMQPTCRVGRANGRSFPATMLGTAQTTPAGRMRPPQDTR